MSEDGLRPWFPNFCRFGAVFTVMVMAELVVLIIGLAPGSGHEDLYAYVTTVSLLSQWIAVMSAGALCVLRPWLSRLPVVTGLVLAYALILALAGLGSWGAGWLDRALGLGWTNTLSDVSELVIGNTIICALVAAAALRYFYIQHRWQRDVEARAEAQLKALQAKIRPHFLFNSMNTIASLIRSSPDRAERAVEDLSELFRAVLRDGSSMSSLGDELSLCERYLELEQLRLGDRLRVDWQVDELPVTAPLPGLVIQPLLENAIYHGIQHLPEGGEMGVRGGRDVHGWWLEIDNPMPSRSPRRRDQGHGMALENIQARLTQCFGERATMKAVSQGGRYVVKLKFPWQPQ